MHHFRKSLMDLLLLILVFICIIVSNCKNLQMFSNYQGGVGEHGKEASIRDYVTLANDPKANLPDSFTICSSIYVKYVTSTSDHFMEVYKEDGGHWFTIVLGTDLRNLDTVNTKSRLRPSVFSVRLFQTQCQLAAGDVSTNLSHFHWRSSTLGI